MKLETLLKLQVLYCALGAAYHIAGFVAGPLLATRPAAGLAVMLVYGLFLVPGFMGKVTLYRALMGVALLALGYGGVMVHVMNYARMDLYLARWAWALAIGINLFGAVLNAMAVFRRFR